MTLRADIRALLDDALEQTIKARDIPDPHAALLHITTANGLALGQIGVLVGWDAPKTLLSPNEQETMDRTLRDFLAQQ